MWIEKRSAKSFKFVEQYKDPLTNKFHRVSVTFSRIPPIPEKKPIVF